MSTFWPGDDRHAVLFCEGIRAPATTAAKLWAFAHPLFNKYGCTIWGISDGSGKYKSLGRMKPRLEEILRTSKLFGMCSRPPGWTPTSFAYLAKSGINISQSFVYLDIKNTLIEVRSEDSRQIAEEMIRVFEPTYCYGFTRPSASHPDYYAVGLCTDNDPPNQRITNWPDYARKDQNYAKHGWLREVYALNYLTDAHLLAPVGDITLKQWIQQSPNRGTLTPVTNEMMLWEVPDERLTELSDQLYAAGRVFDAERDVISKWPKPSQEMSLEEATAHVLDAFGFPSPDEVEIRKGDNKAISEEEKKRIFQSKLKK